MLLAVLSSWQRNTSESEGLHFMPLSFFALVGYNLIQLVQLRPRDALFRGTTTLLRQAANISGCALSAP